MSKKPFKDIPDNQVGRIGRHRGKAEPGVPTPIRAGGRVLPIILVPGTMGSRLALVGDPAAKDQLIWNPRGTTNTEEAHMLAPLTPLASSILADNDQQLVPASMFTHLNAPLTPNNSKQIRHMRRREPRIRHSYEVCWPDYAGFLHALDSTLRPKLEKIGWGLDIDCCGYDWRRTNSESALLLAKRVREARQRCNGERVVLVAHSMGGLVSRSYIWKQGGRTEVRLLVLCGSPSLGATKPYHYLKDGIPLRKDDPAFNKEMRILALALLKTWSKGSVTSYCRNQKFLYELSPRKPYIEARETPKWLEYIEDHTGLNPMAPPSMGTPKHPPPLLGARIKKPPVDPYRVAADPVIGLRESIAETKRNVEMIDSWKRFDREVFRFSGGSVSKVRMHDRTLLFASISHKTHIGDDITLLNVDHDPSQGNTFETRTRSRVLPGHGDTAVPTHSAVPPRRYLYPTPDGGSRYRAYWKVPSVHGWLLNDPTFHEQFFKKLISFLTP